MIENLQEYCLLRNCAKLSHHHVTCLHKHQQEGHHKLCCCLSAARLKAPLTNRVRKLCSASDVNTWHSYEQCLFFSCIVFSVHLNMGVHMNFCVPVGLASTALHTSLSTSLCLVGLMFPSILNVCIHRSLFTFTVHNPQRSMFLSLGCSAIEPTINTKRLKEIGRT